MKGIPLTLWALLIALIVYEWVSWPERHRQAVAVTATEGERNKEVANVVDHQALRQAPQDYLEIADQTLFRLDREGFQQQMEEGIQQVSRPGLPKFRLLGVILTESEPPSAMIFDEKLNESRLLHVGDDLGNWKLQEVGSGYVVLSWRDQLEKVQLRNY